MASPEEARSKELRSVGLHLTWPLYTEGELPDACGMCLREAKEIKQWRIPPCGHTLHAACVDCVRHYEDRD